MSVFAGELWGVLGSVVYAAPAVVTPIVSNETVEQPAVGIFTNLVTIELDEIGETADALRPSHGPESGVTGVAVSPIPGEVDADDSAVEPLAPGDDRIAQSGGILDPLYQYWFPTAHPATDGLPVDLTGIELSWYGSGDERLGMASSSLSEFIRPTFTNILVATVIDYILTSIIAPVSPYVTGLLMQMPFYQPVYNYVPSLTPVSPSFRFHQVQGLNNAEMIEQAIGMDPTNRDYVLDVLAGYMPGIVPGLWSQPSGVGDGSFSVDSTLDCVRSCVSLNGQNGGVCTTVLESVGALTSEDAGTVKVSLDHFANGTYEVDFKIITTWKLTGTGSRVTVSISGADSINEMNPDDATRTGRHETNVTRTITVSDDTPVPALSWTPTLRFVGGSLGKSVEVDGHIVVTGVRRISMP